MVKYKIVKHKLSYHVIMCEGVKKPKTGKPTYKEQVISSHSKVWGGSARALNRAVKRAEQCKNANLSMSKCTEPTGWTFKTWLKELNIAIVLAVLSAILIDLFIKFGGH